MYRLILIVLLMAACTKSDPINCYTCDIAPGVVMNVCDVTEAQLRALVGDECHCIKYK